MSKKVNRDGCKWRALVDSLRTDPEMRALIITNFAIKKVTTTQLPVL